MPDHPKYLLVGDSRLEGLPPLFESYMYDFWYTNARNWSEFTFIGTQIDSTNYVDHRGRPLHLRHEGYTRITSGEMLSLFQEPHRRKLKPDIVLLGLGGNDIIEGIPVEIISQNIRDLIIHFQTVNPNCLIMVEKIAPGHSDFMNDNLEANLVSFHSEIEDLSRELSNESSTVIPVDMAEGWSNEYLADDVHYNKSGAKFISDRYCQVLRDHFIDYWMLEPWLQRTDTSLHFHFAASDSITFYINYKPKGIGDIKTFNFLKKHNDNGWEIALQNGSIFSLEKENHDYIFEKYFVDLNQVLFRDEYYEGSGYLLFDRGLGTIHYTMGVPDFSPSADKLVSVYPGHYSHNQNGIQISAWTESGYVEELYYDPRQEATNKAYWINESQFMLETWIMNYQINFGETVYYYYLVTLK